jgi:hypothetical protein
VTLVVEAFTGATRPELLLSCQRLRYRAYRALGLDTPGMDHARGLEADDGDAAAEFFAAVGADGEIAGCMRAAYAQAGGGQLCLETEFSLDAPWWRGRLLGEGSRFAVLDAHKNGEAPLLLLGAFRAACLRRGIRHLVSIAILPDRARGRDTALGALRFVMDRAAVDVTLARPRPGFEAPELLLDDAPSAASIDPERLPAMIKMLSNARSSLCAMPAYCPRFSAWSFLFRTSLPSGRGLS